MSRLERRCLPWRATAKGSLTSPGARTETRSRRLAATAVPGSSTPRPAARWSSPPATLPRCPGSTGGPTPTGWRRRARTARPRCGPSSKVVLASCRPCPRTTPQPEDSRPWPSRRTGTGSPVGSPALSAPPSPPSGTSGSPVVPRSGTSPPSPPSGGRACSPATAGTCSRTRLAAPSACGTPPAWSPSERLARSTARRPRWGGFPWAPPRTTGFLSRHRTASSSPR